MKVGIRKVHEDEWWVEIGCATLRLNYFQVELLNIVLKEALRLAEGGEYDLLKGFVSLSHKLNLLSDTDLQLLLRQVDDQDLALWLRVLDDAALRERVLHNVGPLVARQLEQDLAEEQPVETEAAMAAIERIMRRAFELDARGEIEFQTEVTEYI
ncbi:FliG C-terminal domain-containing protein [Sulfurivirga sp.]|uniref:FliG C-terminal domain-containing protein n=1 Tax=Sulfurivirga sp. TaxID=2614236 RepID=UPI0025ECC6BB|nr:FliG C-terminal domain-containing protein [Sulfurivirga sp.]